MEIRSKRLRAGKYYLGYKEKIYGCAIITRPYHNDPAMANSLPVSSRELVDSAI